MNEISGHLPAQREYMIKLRNNSRFLGALPKEEISPSDRRGKSEKIIDNVDLSGVPAKETEEELIPVIISARNPVQGELLLAPGAFTSEKVSRRNIKVDRTLGGGEVIARVTRETAEKLKNEGYNITSNETQYILPSYFDPANDKGAETKEVKKDSTIPFELNATTKINELKTTGKGVAIAILDTGIYPHPDIKDKIIAFKDFVNDRETPYDDNGHGTHVAGDAAGTGLLSQGKYKGTAPEANLVGIKVLNSDGGAKVSDIVEGIDWVVQNRDKYNIRIINMSVGVPVTKDQCNAINEAVKRATESGIVVVAAAGNEGPVEGTIAAAPGNSPYAITIGAIDDKNTPQKDDDEIASFSSRGTKDGLLKPDLVAPGTNIVSLRVGGSELDKQSTAIEYIKSLSDDKLKILPPVLYENFGMDPGRISKMSDAELRNFWNKTFSKININSVDDNYISMQGTSMATPLTAGIIADMLEVNPQLSPAQIKDILTKTADDMGQPKTSQGAGVLDAMEAIQVAEKTTGELPDIFAKMKTQSMGYLISGSGGKIAFNG
ncbi:MAG: S8 family peptidase [Candidatus Eremiobacterota bacterium]